MDLQTLLGLILMVWLILVIMPFERRYKTPFVLLGQHPAARLIAAIFVLWISSIDVVLGAIGFTVLFLWIADIQLLSSIKIATAK